MIFLLRRWTCGATILPRRKNLSPESSTPALPLAFPVPKRCSKPDVEMAELDSGNLRHGTRAGTFVPPQFRSSVLCNELREAAMKKLLVAALVAGSFISAEARAQERAGDAALGAVSGAVVLGPVGAVAGAVIGYTAGPTIAHSWGVRRSGSRSHARRTTQLAKSDPRSLKQNSNIQGDATQAASIQGTGEQAAVKVSSSPAIKSSETPPGEQAAPPVQGFE
jgi:hypothetical protein